MKKLKHSKLRNSYLIFETLCRFAMEEIAVNESNKSVRLITKFFNDKTPLGRELSLYESLGNFTKSEAILDLASANDLIETTMKLRGEIDSDALKKAKYRLISEVNDIYGKDEFYAALAEHTKTYKVAASIYKLFEYDEGVNPREIIRCKNTLRESLTTEVNVVSATSHLDEVTQGKVVDLMYEKFQSKYSNLNEKQSYMLGKIATGTLDEVYLNEVVNRLESRINSELNEGVISQEFSEKALSEIRGIDVENPEVQKLQLLVMLLGD